MAIPSVASQLSDRDLLAAVLRAATTERHATVELLRLLVELDERRLYLGEGCSSLFTYCTQVLHLSEHAAYHRIEAARAARRFPVVLDLLGEGALTMTTVALLRPHLTDENCDRLLEAARHKAKRDVEAQIACLAPKPDASAVVRRLPASARPAELLGVPAEPSVSAPEPLRARIAPLAEDRYLLRVTISADTQRKLRQAQNLLRHTIPSGDHAAILDRALTLLVDQLERAKFARARQPRATRTSQTNRRHIPAAVRREVWARDGGRCAFEGPHGRCRETAQLEFHHVVPFAEGGPTDTSNLALRCRAHNAFESEQHFGPFRLARPGA
jgi:5-methylcytosine-specific restriction endonuclease McrA